MSAASPAATISENGARQRAQRRGLSLRKERNAGGSMFNAYWLVLPGANSIIAGGDRGLALDQIVNWLESPAELVRLSSVG